MQKKIGKKVVIAIAAVLVALILICIVLLPTTAEAATYSGKSDPKPYTVEFRNWDGKLISSNTYHYKVRAVDTTKTAGLFSAVKSITSK